LKHPNYLVSQLSSNSGTGRQSLQTGRTVLPSVRTSSAREAPQVYYYHCDPVGLPLALSDEAGAVCWAARHDPWGNIEEAFNADPEHIEQTLRLPGQQHDKATGLYYNRHRFYDPRLGAYISQDPIGLDGGEMNLFAYVRNPLGWIDPLGLSGNAAQRRVASRITSRQAALDQATADLVPQPNYPIDKVFDQVNPNRKIWESLSPYDYKTLDRACKTWICSDGLTCRIVKSNNYIPPATINPPEKNCSCAELGGSLETPSAPSADIDDFLEIFQRLIRSRARAVRIGR